MSAHIKSSMSVTLLYQDSKDSRVALGGIKVQRDRKLNAQEELKMSCGQNSSHHPGRVMTHLSTPQ